MNKLFPKASGNYLYRESVMEPPIDPRNGSTQLTSKAVVQLHVGFGVDVDGAEPEDVDG